MTNLKKPENGAILSILTAYQREFIHEKIHPYDENKIDWAHLERMRLDDYTQPEKHLFLWETDEAVSVLRVCETEDFSASLLFETEGNKLELNNFKAGVTYYWSVNDSEIRSFTTEDTVPRWIEAGGITNVRDAGNWNTKYGCKIRQGLLYRGSEMDIHHTITENGKRTLRKDLKIKTDLDLRGKEALATPGSPMGEQVRFVSIPIGAYAIFMQNNQKQCLEIFEFLSDESNYPVYYHCWGGADRTGTLAFYLGAVFGMSETSSGFENL